MALIVIGDYTNGTIIDRDEWVAELNNIYDTWNGKSIVNPVHYKFNSATIAPFIVDQIGAGLITDFRKSGLSICPIANDGKITSPNVILKKAPWFTLFTADPLDGSNPQLTSGYNRHFIVPSGVSMRITKHSLIFKDRTVIGGGEISASTNISFQLKVNGSVIGSGVRIGGSNTVQHTEYFENLDISVSAGDKIIVSNTSLSNDSLTNLS